MPTEISAPPELTLETAAQLARELWGVDGEPSPLPSYIDANVRLRPQSGPGVVLKVANAGEPREELELQNAAMTHVDARLPGACPRPLATRDGRTVVALTLAGRRHLARLVSFLPGQLYADARPQDDALRASLGRFMGRLDVALADFDHPAADRYIRWDILRADWVAEQLDAIQQPRRRALARGWITRYLEELRPRLA
ncbi:MAG: hypothetical protein KC468_10135, partial [Myxococcales bacterium]|nr:hypothetical protein [Myxococcales bacterium]